MLARFGKRGVPLLCLTCCKLLWLALSRLDGIMESEIAQQMVLTAHAFANRDLIWKHLRRRHYCHLWRGKAGKWQKKWTQTLFKQNQTMPPSIFRDCKEANAPIAPWSAQCSMSGGCW